MTRASLLLPGIGLILASGAIANELPLKEFRVSPPMSIPLPAKPDSAETGKLDFDRSKLLSAKKAADYFHRYVQPDWTTIPTDTAGNIQLESPKKNEAKLYVLTTRMRPQRFVKGALVAKSGSMVEIFVNGESVAKKATSDSTATELRGNLTIEPEMEADIEIHLLALEDDKTTPEISVHFVPDKEFEDVEIAQGPLTPKHFTINTVVLGDRLSSTSLSNDGKYCILSYTTTFGENDTRQTRTLIESATRKVISAHLPENAQWMPQTTELFYSVRSGEGYDFYRMPVIDQRPVLIAKNVPVSSDNVTISPDASFLIYYSTEEGTKEEGIMRRVSEPDDRLPGNRDRYYLRKYDFNTGVETQLTYGGPTTQIAAISPDWKKVIYLATRQTPAQYPFYSTSIVECDLNTLSTDTLASGIANLSSVTYSPDGRRLFVVAGPNSFNEIGKNAGDHEIANDFDQQGFLLEIASRKVTPLTRDFDPAIVSQPIWNSSNGLIYFIGEAGFDQNIYTLDPKTGKFSKLDAEIEYVKNFSMGENDSRWLAYTGMGYTFSGRGYMMDLKTGKSVLLADPMADQLSEIEFGKSENWKFTAEDGTVIDGEINYPPGFDSTQKYPLIVYYYGGTSPSSKRSDHPYTPQLFASRGYVVYVINPSGATGYGQEFSARHVNAWGDRTADEIIQGTKEFCRQHKFIDDKKIGCLGASYGGFMTQLLLTKTDMFAAAMSHAGISNVTSYWGEGFWGYSYNSVAAAKSYPWNNPDLFTKHGSLFNADKIHTPLLLLHGTVDTNVPIGESIQIFNALKILGRDVELITVEGANHVVTDFSKRKVWHATIMAWFAKYLQDDPRWWNSLYGNK